MPSDRVPNLASQKSASPKTTWTKWLRPDPYALVLLSVVVTASILPCRGDAAVGFEWLTKVAIFLLFFMHGAKLSRAAILGGIGAWRLHTLVLMSTFLLFPALGLLVSTLPNSLVSPTVKMGFLFLTILPSTVQSSIAFTSMARGNVAAAVCTASLSNMLGVFITPLLAGLLMRSELQSGGGDLLGVMQSIILTLLAPFLVGHLSRPLIGAWIDRNKGVLSKLDRGAILLVVYTAFSAAVVDGIWLRVSGFDIVTILFLSALVLSVVLFLTRKAAQVARLNKSDEITLVMCGSKKSLASGVPMAAALFAPAQVGVIILPLMIFHQMQLIVCAMIARSYGERTEIPEETEVLGGASA